LKNNKLKKKKKIAFGEIIKKLYPRSLINFLFPEEIHPWNEGRSQNGIAFFFFFFFFFYQWIDQSN